MKLDDLTARVYRAAVTRGMPEYEVQLIVRATVRELGLDVAPDGEVYNPAPREPGWQLPEQRNVRFRGSRRRR
jgi:hypothetical protein